MRKLLGSGNATSPLLKVHVIQFHDVGKLRKSAEKYGKFHDEMPNHFWQSLY